MANAEIIKAALDQLTCMGKGVVPRTFGAFHRTVRRDLATRVGFAAMNCGEDTDYAQRLRPLLHTQAVVADERGNKREIYRYDFSTTATATQGGRDEQPGRTDVSPAVARWLGRIGMPEVGL